ncbi:MAG: glycosyl transferase family 1, partial [Capsulimonas sp.]|nr:glycosyl transferase family 1 [Capsulimonas sp.]
AMLTDGETALLVPAEDPAALTAALRRLAADPGLRTRLAGAGYELVKHHYDIHVQTAAVERVYAGLAS